MIGQLRSYLTSKKLSTNSSFSFTYEPFLILSTTHPGMVGSKVASDIELILVGGAGCVVSRFVGSNRLPAAENVGSIFASTLSTAEVLVPSLWIMVGGERQREGEGILVGEDYRQCLHL